MTVPLPVPNPEPASAIRVLVIDDDRAVCDVVLHILRRSGFEAVGAYDAGTGMTLARESRPDLIVLDVKMPEVDGLEVLSRLKQDAATKDIAVVAFTGLMIEDASLRFQGFDDVILKPIMAAELVERLISVLRAKSPGRGDDEQPSARLSAMWRRVNIA